MVAYRITSVRSLARFLKEHPEVVQVCQFKNGRDGTSCKSKCHKPREKGAKPTRSDAEARFGYQKWGKECFLDYKSLILASSEPLIVPLSEKNRH